MKIYAVHSTYHYIIKDRKDVLIYPHLHPELGAMTNLQWLEPIKYGCKLHSIYTRIHFNVCQTVSPT